MAAERGADEGQQHRVEREERGRALRDVVAVLRDLHEPSVDDLTVGVTGPSLEAIVEERQALGIGPVILGLIQSLTANVTRTYDPTVYAGVASWQDGLEDLVHDVIVDRLLAEGQLDYAIDIATTPEALRALLTRQIKRTLARRRRRTVVDNLLDRVRHILDRDYAMREFGGRTLVSTNRRRPKRPNTFRERAESSDFGRRGISKVPSYSDDRAPIV